MVEVVNFPQLWLAEVRRCGANPGRGRHQDLRAAVSLAFLLGVLTKGPVAAALVVIPIGMWMLLTWQEGISRWRWWLGRVVIRIPLPPPLLFGRRWGDLLSPVPIVVLVVFGWPAHIPVPTV